MNVHRRCPHCDERGTVIAAQDNDDAVACDNDACRVVVFAKYYG